MKYDYLVVGAGFFGAVFAYEAKRQGKRCLVVDKRTHIGGNCYTEKVEGIDVHKYGAHIFHTSDEAIWRYVNQFASFNNFVNSPVANYHGEIYKPALQHEHLQQALGHRHPRGSQGQDRGTARQRARRAPPTWRSRPSPWWDRTSTRSW